MFSVTPIVQPPKGSGPKCSATGPSAATGRKSSAPIRRIVPSRTKPKVTVSVRRVPTVNGRGLLGGQAPRKGEGGDDRHEAADQHHQARGNVQRPAFGGWRRGVVVGVVESPGVCQALKAGAIVGRCRSELVKDLGKPVGPRIAFRLDAPVGGREEARGGQDHQRMDQQGQGGEFHLPGLDLLAHVFGRSADHEPRQKNSHDR